MQEAQSPRDTNFSIFLMEGGKQTAAAQLKKAHVCHAAGLGTGQGAGKHGILRKSLRVRSFQSSQDFTERGSCSIA